jgi:hypothetical protein
MTALGTIKGVLSLGLGDADPHEVADFELPIVAEVESNGPGVVMLGVTVGPDSLASAIARSLRDIADRIDPQKHVDLLDADLAPGAVVLRCSDCDATMIGSRGDLLEHSDGGAHVWSPSYGGGE